MDDLVPSKQEQEIQPVNGELRFTINKFIFADTFAFVAFTVASA
jgi:hypothetical protein